jgi:hypothetical protein
MFVAASVPLRLVKGKIPSTLIARSLSDAANKTITVELGNDVFATHGGKNFCVAKENPISSNILYYRLYSTFDYCHHNQRRFGEVLQRNVHHETYGNH